MRARGLSAVALWCASCVLPNTSNASVFDTYGQSAAGIGLGNSALAGGPSAYAAYTNPAALTASDRSELASSLLVTQFHLQDLPDAPGGQLPPDSSRESKAQALQGVSLGLNLKLNEQLHFGLAGYMPQGNFGRIRGLSPYQSSYLSYSEQQQKPDIFTAIGIRLSPDWSLGLGAYYSLRADGVLQISLNNKESEGRFDLLMEPVVVPYAGLLWAPSQQNFKVGLTYRAAQETKSQISSAFAFSTDDALLPFEAATSLVPFYDPALLRVGASVHGDQTDLHFSLEQARWSAYKTPLVTLTGNDVAALSQELSAENSGLKDTFAYRLGLSHLLPAAGDQSLQFRGGLEYHSSANKTGARSSVVDPARWTLAAGTSWSFAPDTLGRRLTLDAALQHHQLEALKTQTAKGTDLRLRAGSSLQTFVGGLSYVL